MNTAPGPDAHSSGDAPPSPERHSRKCAICNHDEREAIDEAFLHWATGPSIVNDYKLPSLSCLYRHAHAVGLWRRRRKTVRSALHRIIERAGDTHPTVRDIIRAVEICARFRDDGAYVVPPKRLIIEHHYAPGTPKSNREAHD